MRQRFLKEMASAGLRAGHGPSDPVTEAELAALPEAAQRYLRFRRGARRMMAAPRPRGGYQGTVLFR